MLAKFPVDSDAVERHLGYPVVVKTISGSQGTGVFLCETRSNFEDLMQLVEATSGKAIACMKRSSQDGSFKANFSRGGIAGAHELTPEIEWLAAEASRLLGLDIAGIDLLFDGDHFKVCEANSSPGFEGLESCHQISVPEHLFSFVLVRLGQFENLPRMATQSVELPPPTDGATEATQIQSGE